MEAPHCQQYRKNIQISQFQVMLSAGLSKDLQGNLNKICKDKDQKWVNKDVLWIEIEIIN